MATARREGFVGGALTLSGGTLAAQLLPLAATPLLSRLYSAEDFGVYALLLAALGITGQLACLKYDLALVVVRRDSEAVELFYLCLAVASALSILLLGLLPVWNGLSGEQDAFGIQWLGMLPLGTLLLGVNAALTGLALRAGQLSRLTAAMVLRTGLAAAGQLALAPLAIKSVGLAAPYLAAYGVSAFFLIAGLRGHLTNALPTWPALLRAARRHPAYPGFTTVGSLAGGMASNMGSFLLASAYSPAALGWYSMSNRLLSLPLTVLSGPVGQLFTRRLSVREGAGRTRLYLGVSGGLALPAILMLAAGGLLAPLLVPLLGREWSPAVPMLRAMLPLCALRMVVVPVSTAAIVAKRQGATMLWQLLLLAVSATSVILSVGRGLDVVACLWIMSGALGMCYVGWYAYCLALLKRGERA